MDVGGWRPTDQDDVDGRPEKRITHFGKHRYSEIFGSGVNLDSKVSNFSEEFPSNTAYRCHRCAGILYGRAPLKIVTIAMNSCESSERTRADRTLAVCMDGTGDVVWRMVADRKLQTGMQRWRSE